MKDNKKERVLTSLLMGVNCVNGFAPLAATLPIAEQPKPVAKTKAVDEQIEYTPVNYQSIVDSVDRAVFGTAEAAFTENVGTAGACTTNYVSGETVANSGSNTQNISAGGVASNGIIAAGGIQNVYTGGVGNLVAISYGGVQNIYNGGQGSATAISNGGVQNISAGGTGNIATISHGAAQYIYNGGSGNIGVFAYSVVARQIIYAGGTGSVGTIMYNGGSQVVSVGGTGIVDTISGWGYQKIYSGASGSATKIVDKYGQQEVYSGGTGYAGTITGGQQLILGGGTGYTEVVKDYGGQRVDYGGTGYLNVISGVKGSQYISSGGTGKINTMYGGLQVTSFGAHGTIVLLSSGNQHVASGGTATTETMSGGWQALFPGATGIVETMLGGGQGVNGAGTIGVVKVMSGGGQNILSGGLGTVETMRDGVQNVATAGAKGIVTAMSGGSQLIASGGTGTVTSMSGGTQNISGGGTALDTNMIGGVQEVAAGGNVSNNIVAGSGVQNLNGTPGSLVNNVIQSGGVQNVSTGVTVTNQAVGAGGTQNVLAGASAAITSNVAIEGTQNIDGNVTVSAGGNQVITGVVSVAAGGSLLVNGMQTVNAGGTVQGTEVASGGSQVVSGGSVTNNILQTGAQQTVYGGFIGGQEVTSGVTQQLYGGTADGNNITGGTVEMYNPSAALNNVTMTDGLIRLGADGGNYNILGSFDFQGGLVDMTQNPDGHLPNPRTYETLTIAELKGNDGIFKMDTDLESAVYASETTYGDKIVINDGTPGTHYIQVLDKSLFTGNEITGDRKLLLVTDLSGVQNLNYVGKDLNNGGLWHTLPPMLYKEGNKWYLGYIMKEPTNDTTTYLSDRQVAVYNQWTRITNDSLRKRLGDLRYNEADAGVWARYYNGKLGGNNFDQHYHTYQVGIDKTNGNSTFGIALEKQEASQTYGFGSGEGSTTAGNIYYTKYNDTGSYFDAIFKYGKINSKYNTLGTFPDHADYDTSAYSLSLEYGRTNRYKAGYFVEPKVQLTYGHISAENYTTDRGTLVEESAIKSLIGRVGFVAGRKLKDSDYYFKAGLFREFKGQRDVHLAAANGENMYKSENYGDSWFELGIGGNVKLAKKTHLYGDIEKSFGADIQKKWQVNAGVRWEF